MATIKFMLQGKREKEQIYLRLSISKQKAFKRKTGLFINFKDWKATGNNSATQVSGTPKQNTAQNKNLHVQLRNLETHIFTRLNESQDAVITGDWLSNEIDIFLGRGTQEQSELITDLIDNLISNAPTRENMKGGTGISKSRINDYRQLKNLIIRYQKRKRKSYKIQEVNKRFSDSFKDWMISDCHYSKNYSIKKLSDLKTVCRHAKHNGIEVSYDIDTIKLKGITKELPIYLTPQELDKIKNTPIIGDALQNARKWLLFGCYIGQRGGDLLNITENDFVNRGGNTFIEITQQKTGTEVAIPLLPDAQEIIKDGMPYKISLQKLNDYIKEVCKIAEINQSTEGMRIIMVDKEGNEIPKDTKGKYATKGEKRYEKGIYPKYELITTHVCRRSFASNFYGTIPTPFIMSVTGHKKENVFLAYIGKTSTDYATQFLEIYNKTKQQTTDPYLKIYKSNQQ